MTVWLYTSDDRFVHKTVIHGRPVLPDVLFWGERTFVRRGSHDYVEATTYFIVDFSPASKAERDATGEGLDHGVGDIP